MKVPAITGIFLGLVHETDGLGGTLQRIAVVKRHLTALGVATECGFGRSDKATVPMLMDLMRATTGRA